MTSTAQESSGKQDEQWPAQDAGGGTRKMVLYGLLALMIVALAYDYLVARPAVSEAYDQITTASIEANRKGTEFLSNEKVRELIGKQPAETFMDGSNSVEVFHWRGGLIVKPHKLYTVYAKNGDNWLFFRHAKFAYERSSDVLPDRSIVPAPEGEDLEAEYMEEGESGGPGPGGAGGGGGGGGAGFAPSSAPPQSEAPQPEAPAAEAPAAEAPSRPELESEQE